MQRMRGGAIRLDFPAIRTRRLVLRPAAVTDADRLFPHLQDWDVVRMLAGVAWPPSRDELERHIADVRASARMGGGAVEVAILPDGGEPAGLVGIEQANDEPLIGYWLGRAYWGRGIMTEAVGAVLDHLFELKPGCRVISGVFHDNPASLAVQRKLGFEIVGEHRQFCRARGVNLRHIDTAVDEERFREARS